jgi:PAS domain S-box-containing protein
MPRREYNRAKETSRQFAQDKGFRLKFVRLMILILFSFFHYTSRVLHQIHVILPMTGIQRAFVSIDTPNDDFQSLFATHPSPMWVYDPDTLHFLIVNNAAIDLYGYSREAYAGMTVLDIRPAHERQRMITAVHGRTDMERAERWTHLKADGEMVEVLTYGRSVRFDGRDAILAIVQDQTEVNAAHREVSDTRSLLDSIVDNLPVGVFVKDMEADGLYILFNEACGTIVGRDSGRCGRQERSYFRRRKAGRRLPRAGRARLSARGSTISFEETMRGPTASSRMLRTVKRALPAPDGSPPRYLLGISQDVTEERSVEARLAYMAMHDALTGMPNRAFFSDQIRRAAKAPPPSSQSRCSISTSIISSTSTTARGMPPATRCCARWRSG